MATATLRLMGVTSIDKIQKFASFSGFELEDFEDGEVFVETEDPDVPSNWHKALVEAGISYAYETIEAAPGYSPSIQLYCADTELSFESLWLEQSFVLPLSKITDPETVEKSFAWDVWRKNGIKSFQIVEEAA